jgi:hypothetical protein
MTRVEVNPGVCRMNSTIEVATVRKRLFSVRVDTDCEMIVQLGELLSEIDLASILKPQILESKVYQLASECGVHASCPIPMAIQKAIEVESGLALARSVSVDFQPV